MMKYIIINIKDYFDSWWGNTIIVIANEIKRLGDATGFTPYETNESKYFMFPNRNDITEVLIKIANSRQPWTPSEDFNESLQKINGRNVFEHISLYKLDKGYDDTLNGGYTSDIKNLDEKVEIMLNRYLKGNHGEDVEEYINMQPSRELWVWLFELDYLSDVKPQGLLVSNQRHDAYEDFVNRVQELYEGTEI